MKFYERNLEDIIWDNLRSEKGRKSLYDKGLPVPSIDCGLFRQFNLGKYGILDLLAVSPVSIFRNDSVSYGIVKIKIYELKRGKCDVSSVVQISKYITGLRHFFTDALTDLINVDGCDIDVSMDCFLVGAEITQEAMLLLNCMQELSFVRFDFCLDQGLRFDEENCQYQHTHFDPKHTDIYKSGFSELLLRNVNQSTSKR